MPRGPEQIAKEEEHELGAEAGAPSRNSQCSQQEGERGSPWKSCLSLQSRRRCSVGSQGKAIATMKVGGFHLSLDNASLTGGTQQSPLPLLFWLSADFKQLKF